MEGTKARDRRQDRELQPRRSKRKRRPGQVQGSVLSQVHLTLRDIWQRLVPGG